MEFFRIRTIELGHRDHDAMPIEVMQHSVEHHTCQSPIRSQIQVHYTPRNVYFEKGKKDCLSFT